MASGSSLSHVTASGRKVVIWGAIFIVTLIFGRYFYGFARTTYTRLNPPPTPAPTVGFGRLPSPAFPSQLQEDKPQSYELGTVGNRFPGYGSQIAVYFIPTATPNLTALDRAREKANNLDFVFPPEKVTNDIYRWRQSNPLSSSLEMNIITGTLEMKVDWASSVTLLDKRNIPSRDGVRSKTRDLMRQAGILQTDVATAEPELTYVRALAGEIRPVASVSEADFVRANIYRVGPQGIPTVTSNPEQGVVSALFSGSQAQGEDILEFTSQYYPVDWKTFHTYPMISATAAFDLLKAGEGFIATPLPSGKTTAVIRNVFLAYYEPSAPQNYYQPVYVFTGDDNFRAIVPALHPQIFTVAE
jgi:hypothetical protein